MLPKLLYTAILLHVRVMRPRLCCRIWNKTPPPGNHCFFPLLQPPVATGAVNVLDAQHRGVYTIRPCLTAKCKFVAANGKAWLQTAITVRFAPVVVSQWLVSARCWRE